VVGGDRLDIQIEAEVGASVLLTTPAAGKFYRSGGREARQNVRIDARGAMVEWLPQEAIFYRDANVTSTTVVNLNSRARLIAWDIVCCGLPARNEIFEGGRLLQGLEVWREGTPWLLDRLSIDGATATMQAPWGLAGRPVFGTMLAYPVVKADLDALRAIDFGTQEETIPGLTLIDGLLVCRGLESHADALKRRFTAIWECLRPRLLGRPAQAPRIWAT
jgi:urease accessory protein